MIFKFRAFDVKTNQLLDHQQLMELQYPQHMIRDPYHYDVFADKSLKIDMLTPFEDANGVTIFQSDVIETKESRTGRFCFEVIFDEETSSFMAQPFMKGRAGLGVAYRTTLAPQPLHNVVKVGATIIGNKYLNPELYRRGV